MENFRNNYVYLPKIPFLNIFSSSPLSRTKGEVETPSKTKKSSKVNESANEEISRKFDGKDLCDDWFPIQEGYGDLLEKVIREKGFKLTSIYTTYAYPTQWSRGHSVCSILGLSRFCAFYSILCICDQVFSL